uniref:Anoctamin n=1 Tax=Caenorhabditis tropicalis TaxID=1561998 RepID=A0A1I7TIX9_9PELO
MDQRSSSESSEDSIWSSSTLSTISEHTEPDSELQSAISEDTSDLPDVFESATEINLSSDVNNNRQAQIVENSSIIDSESQDANLEEDSDESQSSTVVSSSCSDQSTPENGSESGSSDPSSLPIVGSENQISSGVLSPSSSSRGGTSPEFSEDKNSEESPPPSPRRPRLINKRLRQMGFDCYFLPDHRWKFGYRLMRGCRHWINHYRMTVQHEISDEEWNLDFEEYYRRQVQPRIQFGTPEIGKPFDMFSETIMRRAVNYTFFREVLRVIYLIQYLVPAAVITLISQFAIHFHLRHVVRELYHFQLIFAKFEKFAKYLDCIFNGKRERSKRSSSIENCEEEKNQKKQ